MIETGAMSQDHHAIESRRELLGDGHDDVRPDSPSADDTGGAAFEPLFLVPGYAGGREMLAQVTPLTRGGFPIAGEGPSAFR
jgi:hypothetical protein